MTNKEFKAWFEGFTEALSGTPTKAQWARIKERVAEINGEPITERIYVDRYYRYYPPYYTTWGMASGSAVGNSSVTLLSQNGNVTHTAVPFSSTHAMYAAGKADAQAASEGVGLV